MNRNDKPAGVKVTPDTPAPRTEGPPKAAKGRGPSNKGLGGPRTNPGQTPDTPSAAFRQGSAPPSPSTAQRSGGTPAAGLPPALEQAQAPQGRAARSKPPAPPARPADVPAHAHAQALDALWAEFLALPPHLTAQDVEAVERNGPAGPGPGRTRRAALALLTKSGAELAGLARDRQARRAVEDVAACLEDYRQSLAGLAELMDLAADRLSLALCEPVPA